MTQLKPAEKTVATACNKAKGEMVLVAVHVLQLSSNLLEGKARQPRTKMVAEQIDAAPWTDIQGVKHSDTHCKSWDSFMKCVRFHLLTVFANSTVETKRYYISKCLKKPNRVHKWQFVQRVQQCNGYLELLPCLFYSP